MRGADYGVHKVAVTTVDWKRLREDFPILREQAHGHPLIYFDSAATSAQDDKESQDYVNSLFVSAKALTANSKSSRECAAETWVRTRAVPWGTTG